MPEIPKLTPVPLRALSPDTEYSTKFLQAMLDRMCVSYHKYGKVSDAVPHKIAALESAVQRVQKYMETHNTEYLVDAANFMMMEFMFPSIEGAFFEGTSEVGSPGRVTVGGDIVGNVRNETL